MPKIHRPLIALILLSLPIATAQQPPNPKPESKTAPAAIYNESADAKAYIKTALAKATRDNTRVLVIYGGNWCGWCHKLHTLFKTDPDISKTLKYEYQLVMIDIGRFDKNMDIAATYGADLKSNGVPYLTILDANAKPLINQETGALESGDNHDPKKVHALLTQHKAPALDAREVLSSTLAAAKKQDKRIFLHFSAPWCGWCHKLEDFLARKEISEIMSIDFIDLKIDQDRMTNAAAISKNLRPDDKGGIPWFAILDPAPPDSSSSASSKSDTSAAAPKSDSSAAAPKSAAAPTDASAKILATSDGPKGNIGYPAAPEEIAHFIEMLKKTTRKITPAQIATIEKALKDSAPPPR